MKKQNSRFRSLDWNLVDNAVIDYEMGLRCFPILKRGIILKNGKTELKGTMKVPGFYRVRVWAVSDGRRYEGLATQVLNLKNCADSKNRQISTLSGTMLLRSQENQPRCPDNSHA